MKTDIQSQMKAENPEVVLADIEAKRGLAAPTGSADWRKLAPDIPGWWLVALEHDGKWTMTVFERIEGKPWMTRPEWWYAGPVSPPNKQISDS